MRGLKAILMTAIAVSLCNVASATTFNLTNGVGFADGNTGNVGTGMSTTIDLLSNFGSATPVGTGIVTVDYLFEQNYYIDDGTGTVRLTALPYSETISGSTVMATYTGPGYDVDLTLDLVAGDTLAETVVIRPSVDNPNFRIWAHTDFDVPGPGGGAAGDDAIVVSGSEITQVDGVNFATVEVLGPTPDFYETGGFQDVLNLINTGTDLNNTDLGPSPGDNEFGFQWNLNLAMGQPITLSLEKTYGVPEPASGLALLMGLAGLLACRRNA